MLKNKWLNWALVIFWMGVIFYLSSQPAFTVSSDTVLDNLAHVIAHMIEYGILVGLWINAVRFHVTDWVKNSILSGIISGLYAVSDEWHQSFVPTRQASVADLMADWAGIFLVIVIINYLLRLKRVNGIKT